VRENPSTKKPGEWTVVETSYVLSGRDIIAVEQFAPKGKRKADIPRPDWKVDQKVVCEFESLTKDKYGVRARGTLVALD